MTNLCNLNTILVVKFSILSKEEKRNSLVFSRRVVSLGYIKTVYLMSHKAFLPLRWPQAHSGVILTKKVLLCHFCGHRVVDITLAMDLSQQWVLKTAALYSSKISVVQWMCALTYLQ